MKDISKLTPSERAVVLAKREYMRRWRESNPTKQQEYNNRFFHKKSCGNHQSDSTVTKKPPDLLQQTKRRTKHEHRQPTKPLFNAFLYYITAAAK